MSTNQDNTEIISRVLSGARWAMMIRLAAQAVSWLSTIIVVRFISTHDYGLNAMLEAPMGLLFLLSTFGLDMALVRVKNVSNDELRSVFGWLLVVNGLLFLAYFFGGTLLAAYFKEPRLELLSRALAFVFLLVPFRVIPDALLDRELKFKLKASAELISSVVTTVVTLILAVMGAGIWALVDGMLVNRFLLAVLLMSLQPWIVKPSFKFSIARGMIAFGGTMALATAVATVGNMLPVWIAGPKLGAETLGVFAVAMSFALLPLTKIMPVLIPIIFPAFAKFQGQPVAVAHYLEKTLEISSLVLLPVMVGMACVAEEFVMVVLGEQWELTVVPLALLSLVVPFRAVASLLRQVLGGIGFARTTLISVVIYLLIFLPLVMLGSNYGILGVVLAVIVTEPIVTLATIRLSKHAIDTSFSKILFRLRPAVISSAIMAAGVLGVKGLLHQSELIRLVFEVFAGLVIYVAVLRVFFNSHLDAALRLLLGKSPV
ncbi:MAG: lipopolysaccharide biosynthesis protein [Gallionellales bacterium CG_4_10_14_3_um_filter_54_96]|nr:MAG: lipopolysaccharide biosynthesis protein [Gallionellales bacterium CG17_big_fil_post_rev_8_21_14_2_50_54_146]PIX05232.1 MAG: lipopolysaccharide biosynthesis protein [Gallionellales bacterium CG_4_8_14_3_um_filter_54_18]PIY04200.1 MAG: lipopolysaccharide biosynthesis protein [Gallionellales bacterium CG_4_10_14_3_um_filter_54_96]